MATVLQVFEIGTGAKCRWRAREHDRADVVARFDVVDGCHQLVVEDEVDRVAPRRIVESDCRDAVGDSDEHVSHRPSLPGQTSRSSSGPVSSMSVAAIADWPSGHSTNSGHQRHAGPVILIGSRSWLSRVTIFSIPATTRITVVSSCATETSSGTNRPWSR